MSPVRIAIYYLPIANGSMFVGSLLLTKSDATLESLNEYSMTSPHAVRRCHSRLRDLHPGARRRSCATARALPWGLSSACRASIPWCWARAPYPWLYWSEKSTTGLPVEVGQSVVPSPLLRLTGKAEGLGFWTVREGVGFTFAVVYLSPVAKSVSDSTADDQ